jgi:hypothetical protein
MITGQARWVDYALVRDAQGRPKFDSIHGIDPRLWAMLTDAEQQEVRSNGGYPRDRDP